MAWNKHLRVNNWILVNHIHYVQVAQITYQGPQGRKNLGIHILLMWTHVSAMHNRSCTGEFLIFARRVTCMDLGCIWSDCCMRMCMCACRIDWAALQLDSCNEFMRTSVKRARFLKHMYFQVICKPRVNKQWGQPIHSRADFPWYQAKNSPLALLAYIHLDIKVYVCQQCNSEMQAPTRTYLRFQQESYKHAHKRRNIPSIWCAAGLSHFAAWWRSSNAAYETPQA